jgi:hypothetical protein
LKWHTEHPHVYNPLLMAAADGGLTGEVWEWKAEQTREAREDNRPPGRRYRFAAVYTLSTFPEKVS